METIRSKAAWVFGCILCIAALAFHHTAHYWYHPGLQVMSRGGITVPYAIALILLTLACAMLLWHYVGSRFSSRSMLRRFGWCVGLAVAATIVVYSLLAVVLGLSAVVYAGMETGQGVLALLLTFIVVVSVGAVSVLVPAVPYGAAAGTAFYVIAEALNWVKRDGT